MKSVAKCPYFEVFELPLKPGRKTVEYAVLSINSGECLGSIKWYGAWRQFCFYPEPFTIWNHGCLDDIRDFLLSLKKIRAERNQT